MKMDFYAHVILAWVQKKTENGWDFDLLIIKPVVKGQSNGNHTVKFPLNNHRLKVRLFWGRKS
jgi:hypothetical protein